MSTLEQVKQIVREHHQYAREWKARTGGQVLGYFCSYVPEELAYAAGTLPVRVLGSHEPQDVTEPHITSKWCPACRDVLAQGLLGRYDYLDGLLYAHCCIHMRQAYVSWCRHRPPSFCHALYVPSYIESPSARQNLIGGIADMKRSLEAFLARPITREALLHSMEVYDTNRRLLKEIYALRKAEAPPLTGKEAMEIVLSTLFMEKEESNRLLTEVLKELRQREGRKAGDRLMLLGSGSDDLAFLEMVESLGATVVVDDHCIGARHFWSQSPSLDGADPIAALADRYIAKPPCPNKDLISKRRIAFIVEMAREFRARGVVAMQQKFCDPHQWDAVDIRSALAEIGIPLLILEADIVVPVGQFRTRVEAFLEMLEAEGL